MHGFDFFGVSYLLLSFSAISGAVKLEKNTYREP